MLTAAQFPNDIDALKALLLARDEQIVGLKAQLNTRAAEIEHLKLWIAKLRRMQFGRKSEKLDHQIEQLELQLEDLQADDAEAEREMPPADQAPRQRAPRKPLPEHLPRDEKVYLPATTDCPSCGGNLKQLGEDVAEQLEFVPASFRVIRHVRPKLACACCDAIVQAPAPSRPIERGIAGPGLLAHVLVAKFADHLPLYRQSVIYAREGVDLDRALLASWVGAASALLRPLIDAIRKHVLAAVKLHADDTPAPVLAPGNGKTKTGRLWTYVRDDRPAGDSSPPAVCFAYSPERKGIHPQTHLANFEGCCRQMLMPASTLCTRVVASKKRHAGRTRAASSRPARGAAVAAYDRGAAPHRRTVSDRGRGPRQTTRRAPVGATGARATVA